MYSLYDVACSFSHPVRLILSHLLTININAYALYSIVRWQPSLRILVVEWPGWNNDEEGESGASETDVERQPNVLCHVADQKGDDLS